MKLTRLRLKEIIREELFKEAIDSKSLKKDLDKSLKGVRKNNFAIAKNLNKVNKSKAKKAMALFKRYIIEYQIRVHKLLREL